MMERIWNRRREGERMREIMDGWMGSGEWYSGYTWGGDHETSIRLV